PNCSDRSKRRISTRSITSLGSTATRAANFTVETSVHGSSRVRAPLVPASSAVQVLGTSPPSGVVAPRPVTTTRGLLLIIIIYYLEAPTMKLTASATVPILVTSSSGIFTPNFSSEATMTSTMLSESTSRSSLKLFDISILLASTPATSTTISLIPASTSSWVSAIFLSLFFYLVSYFVWLRW